MTAPLAPRRRLPPLPVVKNVCVSMLFMFLTGGLYDLGVFNLAVDTAFASAHSAPEVWSSSMAYASVTGTVTMLLSGVILSSRSHASSSPSSQTFTLRMLCLFAAFSYSLLCVGAYAIRIQSTSLIRLAFASLGNGYGIYYLVAVELSAAWLPHHAALAIGFCQMSFGVGSIVFTDVFSRLQSYMHIDAAVFATSVILSLPCFAACMLVEWPQPSSFSATAPTCPDPQPLSLHNPADGLPISWKRLPKLPLFWLYIVSLSAAQAPYMFIPYFFHLGHSFNTSMSVAVRCFQAINLLGTLVRPLVGPICDAIALTPTPLSLGTKNAIVCLLGMQLILFMVLIPISHMVWFGAFAFCSGLTVILFAASACLSALLGRELFGKNNSALIFGVGGSVAMGIGEFVAVFAVERLVSHTESGPSAFVAYYYFATAWTVLGLIASVFLYKSPDAFSNGPILGKKLYGSIKRPSDNHSVCNGNDV